ncbi:MAG TPA: ABC transporter ATP-binding protein [Candidatus Saccharimonadia bacterium]|nr:ABC transporter ATP-binding protein [Candidatus Saccharimonadia bacterium]
MRTFELQHITKQYDDETTTDLILQDINLTVEPGELLCLMGPSGCGKSTLLRIMAGLVEPTSGHVVNRPPRIGMVFQNFGLMPWLTVADNIGFGLKMGGQHPKAIKREVDRQIESLGLHGLGQSHPKELSGGQKQRVGIARALAIDPDVLMLDEAFSALDTATAEELRADLLRIWQETGKTIVMVTHQPAEAAQLASRIVVFTGRPGAVEQIIVNKLPRPRHQRSDEFFKLVDRLEGYVRA